MEPPIPEMSRTGSRSEVRSLSWSKQGQKHSMAPSDKQLAQVAWKSRMARNFASSGCCYLERTNWQVCCLHRIKKTDKVCCNYSLRSSLTWCHSFPAVTLFFILVFFSLTCEFIGGREGSGFWEWKGLPLPNKPAGTTQRSKDLVWESEMENSHIIIGYRISPPLHGYSAS